MVLQLFKCSIAVSVPVAFFKYFYVFQKLIKIELPFLMQFARNASTQRVFCIDQNNQRMKFYLERLRSFLGKMLHIIENR
jgi:hypothetical protein